MNKKKLTDRQYLDILRQKIQMIVKAGKIKPEFKNPWFSDHIDDSFVFLNILTIDERSNLHRDFRAAKLDIYTAHDFVMLFDIMNKGSNVDINIQRDRFCFYLILEPTPAQQAMQKLLWEI